MLKKILYVIIFLVVAYLVLCLAGPKKMDVTTTKTIAATPTAVYSQIADLRNMKNWSKWLLEDTSMTLTYGKTTSGVGGTYSWKSEKSGEGSMTIKSTEPDRMLAYDLNFKDWGTTSDVKMELKPNGAGTDVTWSMVDQKEANFFKRGIMLILGMNGMIKKDFEKGLSNLETYLKSHPNAVLLNGFNITEGNFTATDYLGKREIVKMSDISANYEKHLSEIGKLAGANIKGAPAGIYWKWDEANMTADMAAVMPVSKKDIANEVYSVISIPGSKEFVLDYYGSYDNMMGAHETLDSVIKMNGHAFPEVVIEEYITDPMSQKDTSQWYTKIHYLVK